MTYKRDIELVFDMASFQPHQPNSRIDLWYIGDNRKTDAAPKTAEKEFFLQTIRDHVRGLPQNRTKVSHLLKIVRAAWDKGSLLSSQINQANITFPITINKTSDSSIALTASLLLVPLETRVEIIFNLSRGTGSDGVEVAIASEARVVYGEHFNFGKMNEFLVSKIGDKIGAREESWSDVLVELRERLIARGRK